MTTVELESQNPQICYTFLQKQQSSNEKLFKIISKKQEEREANCLFGKCHSATVNSQAECLTALLELCQVECLLKADGD